jgi:hypothetical protein
VAESAAADAAPVAATTDGVEAADSGVGPQA